MKRQKIVVSVIAGDDVHENKLQGLKDLLNSVRGYVDKVYIGYNGTQKNKILRLKKDNPGFVEIDFFKWEDDFGAARNQAFSFIPMHEYDWLMWLDSDDVLCNQEELHPMLNDLDFKTQAVFLKYDYAVDKESNSIYTEQWRERILRTDATWRWKYPIHEVCYSTPGIQAAHPENVWVEHRREIPDLENTAIRDDGTRERNRRIITRAMRKDPNDARLKYYFANEVYAEAMQTAMKEKGVTEEVHDLCIAAIEAYEQYLDTNPSPDEAYITIHQIASLHRMVNSDLKAIESELQALMIHPSWPSALIGIAESYANVNDWDKVIFWCDAVLKMCSKPSTSIAVEPLDLTARPHYLLAVAYKNKGDYDNAIKHYEEVEKITPTKSFLDHFEKFKKQVEEEKNKEVIINTLREDNFSSSKEKSIAFLALPAVEPWSTKSIFEGGIGGTETAICEIARRFAADGWRTVIFGSPHEEYRNQIVDGIEWYDTNDFSPVEEFTVFVGLRAPQIFESDIRAKFKILWMHDVNAGDTFETEFGNMADKVHFIAGVSDWHCDHMSKLYSIPREKFITLRNGINLDRFNDLKDQVKDTNKIVWSSSPDRGLDVLLVLWPEIRKINPDAELHIFYGWETIDRILKLIPNHSLKNFKALINDQIDYFGGEDGGIFWRGRTDQNKLAEELSTATFWLYPSYFLETCCITALEMQAAKVIPIVSNHGGLVENLTEYADKIDGWPNNVVYQDAFLRTFKSAYASVKDNEYDKERVEKLLELGKEFANSKTWDDSYRVWESLTSIVKPNEESV